MTGTNVKDNSAVAGGGLFNQGTLNVASSNINSNQASGGAGGVGIGGGILSNGGSVALSNSTLIGNGAIGGRRGQRRRRWRWHRRRCRS